MSVDQLVPSDEHAAYSAWFSVNYNLVQTRRMMTSGDPVYRTAAEVRMSWHGLNDLLGNYLALRQERWAGEKAAIRYLEAKDPTYLADLRRFLTEPDANRRMELYERMAALAVKPFGSIWPSSCTAMLPQGSERPLEEELSAVHALWARLVEATDSPGNADRHRDRP